jgi:hypothetical protein
VGIDELKRRLGVSRGDTEKKATGKPAIVHRLAAASERAVKQLDSDIPESEGVDIQASASSHSSKSGVPPGDTSAGLRKKPDLSGLVSQKQASVSQGKQSVSQNRASVSQGYTFYLKKKKNEEEENTPLPPSQAMGGLFPDGPESSLPPDPKTSNRNNLPVKRRAPAAMSESALAEAVAKVMRECNLSEPRLGPVIERAMRTEAAKTDEATGWNGIAERMIAAQRLYVQLGRDGVLRVTVRVRRFLAEGLWRDDGLWAIDREALNRRQNARIGSYEGGPG